MTAPDPPATRPGLTFFRRRFAPLIIAWVVAVAIAGLIYWFEKSMPAFQEVVGPLYWIIGTLIVLGTWRWVRTRGKQNHDRRAADRRHADRRHGTDNQATEPPGS